MVEVKLAEKIADQIERRIIEEALPVGTLIGSEGQLLARYKVSRAVLRESILILEQRQIARRQRGHAGGVIVRAPEARSVARAISLFLEFGGVTPDDLLEARMLLEGHCAAKAAHTAPAERARQLKTHALAGLSMTGEEARVQMGQFHVLLAQLADNPVWSLMTEALVEAASSLLQRAGRFATESEMRRQFKLLVAIGKSIENHEETRARSEVENFIAHVQRYYVSNPRPTPGNSKAVEPPPKPARKFKTAKSRRGAAVSQPRDV
jgi:DNA-binding FadR family transcriptional regulator